jgi:RNA polymerase sigma-70 factor (ECF subfamily)
MWLVRRVQPLVGFDPMWGGQPRTSAPRAGEPARDRNGGGDALEIDEVELMGAIAAGDRAALAALYDLHAPIVMSLAKRMLRDPAAAEDLAHDVFVEVWQHAAEFDRARGSVRAWIVVRTRSRALDRLGRAARDARTVDRVAIDVEGDAATPGVHTAVDGERVRGLLGALPDELRAVLDLAYFEGLSASESAARLAVPIGTVKSRLARALDHLRRALAGPEERGP